MKYLEDHSRQCSSLPYEQPQLEEGNPSRIVLFGFCIHIILRIVKAKGSEVPAKVALSIIKGDIALQRLEKGIE